MPRVRWSKFLDPRLTRRSENMVPHIFDVLQGVVRACRPRGIYVGIAVSPVDRFEGGPHLKRGSEHISHYRLMHVLAVACASMARLAEMYAIDQYMADAELATRLHNRARGGGGCNPETRLLWFVYVCEAFEF